MKWYTLKSWGLKIFGDIKVFKWPMFLIYQPTTFRCKAEHYRMALKKLKAGDLIFRKYYDYLDGKVIFGEFSHCGIYVGKRTIIHAIAEGVQEIDLLDYLRCDAFCILRPKSGQIRAIQRAKRWKDKGKSYDFNFESNNSMLYCHELGAKAYEELEVKQLQEKFFFGLFKAFPAYLYKSFAINKNFKMILKVKP